MDRVPFLMYVLYNEKSKCEWLCATLLLLLLLLLSLLIKASVTQLLCDGAFSVLFAAQSARIWFVYYNLVTECDGAYCVFKKYAYCEYDFC